MIKILSETTGGTKFSGFSNQELHDFRYDAKIALMHQLLDILDDGDYHTVSMECTENFHPQGIQYFYTCVISVDGVMDDR